MVITNANNVENIVGILNGEDIGTLFLNHRNKDFDLKELIYNAVGGMNGHQTCQKF